MTTLNKSLCFLVAACLAGTLGNDGWVWSVGVQALTLTPAKRQGGSQPSEEPLMPSETQASESTEQGPKEAVEELPVGWKLLRAFLSQYPGPGY